LVRKIFTFYINDVLIFKCPFPGPKDLKELKKTGKRSVTDPVSSPLCLEYATLYLLYLALIGSGRSIA